MAIKKGKMISVVSTKGGVGKTILSLNLLNICSNLNLKTLIIDLDLYSGSLALDLKVNADKTVYTLIDDLSNNRFKNISDYTTKINDHTEVLAAPKDPRQASKIESKYIDLLLNNAKYRYDVIILDNYHILDKTSIVAMDASDYICYIVTNDLMDLKNAKTFMAILKDSERENVKVILNESINTNKNYFSKFDIKNILKTNIDYTISKNMHIRNIDKYLMDGNLELLCKQFSQRNKKEYNHIIKIITDIIDGE